MTKQQREERRARKARLVRWLLDKKVQLVEVSDRVNRLAGQRVLPYSSLTSAAAHGNRLRNPAVRDAVAVAFPDCPLLS